MKKNKIIFILLVVLVTMCSCSTTRYYSLQPEYNKKYCGQTKGDIIRSFGPPSRIVDIDEGEYILVYEQYEWNTTTSSYSSTNSNADASAYSDSYGNVSADAYGNSRNYSNSHSRTTQDREFTEFYMTDKGHCYYVKTSKVGSERKVDVVGSILVSLLVSGLVVLGIYFIRGTGGL